jgi:putative tryptophan/tyrosine transport system substrate-binding protein
LGARRRGRWRFARSREAAGRDENDPVAKTYVSAFTQALADLGWTVGRNVRMDLRGGGGDINRIQALAQELVGLQPDIILTGAASATVAVQRETRTIPIVFTSGDPASGIVPRLNRPGGNITGFVNYEASLGGKWLELLSEIAPALKRAAIMFNPDTAPTSNLRRRPGHSRSSKSLSPFITTQRSKRPSWPLGASREAALSSTRIYSWLCIAR